MSDGDLEEIEAILRAEPSELRNEIVCDIGNFTVALFGVFESKSGDRLQLAGTGTLVTVLGSHYILTAAHVWEEVLKSARMVGMTLKEKTDHRFLMEANEIVKSGLPTPNSWGEWGPDLALLCVPPERVGSIQAYGRTFYNLTKSRESTPDVDCIETYVLMGTPEAAGTFTQTHADIQINGFFALVDASVQSRDNLDYLDFNLGELSPGIPENFGGVSGGGLWKVHVYKSASCGKIQWLRSLQGVAFYHQKDLAIIRCHGEQSIGAVMQNAKPS